MLDPWTVTKFNDFSFFLKTKKTSSAKHSPSFIPSLSITLNKVYEPEQSSQNTQLICIGQL